MSVTQYVVVMALGPVIFVKYAVAIVQIVVCHLKVRRSENALDKKAVI